MLISALAVMPCSDSDTCEKEGISQIGIDHQSNHDHSEDSGDLCTPFCSCTCCGCSGFVIHVPYFDIIGSRLISPRSSTIYQSNFVSTYFYSFWQPPKLSLS
jgi:hypothetical protein